MIKRKKDIQRDNDFNKQTSVLTDLKEQVKKEDSDYSKVTELLLNDSFGRRKTIILSDKQAKILTSLDVIAQIYDIPFLKNYIEWYTQYLTSVGGKGRQDIVDISKFKFAEQEKMNNRILELMGRNSKWK